jgi:hypothetical protein
MTDSSFRSAVINQDIQACQKFYSQNISGAELVQILNDLLFCSVSVKQSTIKDLHPVCILNSIKNLIGDDRENPSKPLLEFSLDYLCSFEFRDDDQTQLDEVVRDGIGLTAFLGDLEDACQQGEWEDLQKLTAKTFMASDRSRGTMDAFAELALQDCEKSAIFIFHLLRAYQFQEVKEDNWAFTKCILEWMRVKPLPEPHDQTDSSPSDVHDLMIESGDLSLLGAVSRLWEGDYVRIRGYQREISHWCSQAFFTTLNIKPSLNHWLLKDKKMKFIHEAETIVKSQISQSEKANALVILEAVRSLLKTASPTQFGILGARLDQLIR